MIMIYNRNVNTPDVDSAQIFIVNRKAALSFDDGTADSASSCLWSGNDISNDNPDNWKCVQTDICITFQCANTFSRL